MSGDAVACINRGSSSIKYALHPVDANGVDERPSTAGTLAADSLDDALDALTAPDQPSTVAVGHRLVHGGAQHVGPALVDDELLTELDALVPFAPLHLPPAIEAIRAVRGRLPGVPQVACFDTAFHRRLPEVSQRLPLPRSLWDAGIRRYGFHGLSYEYVSDAISASALGRVVIAHLGSGASLVALRDGLPVHTTMGLTPTGGVVMGTRPGDLDPGVLVHLLTHLGYDNVSLELLLNDESGLLGLSGTTADVRALLAARDAGDRDAGLALASFVHSVAMAVGALAAVLDGLDVLVFTGGIGEHAGAVRAEVGAMLGHLGVQVDDAGQDGGGRCRVIVVPTNEELMIARHTWRCVAPMRSLPHTRA